MASHIVCRFVASGTSKEFPGQIVLVTGRDLSEIENKLSGCMKDHAPHTADSLEGYRRLKQGAEYDAGHTSPPIRM
jgi:hypothetical protein